MNNWVDLTIKQHLDTALLNKAESVMAKNAFANLKNGGKVTLCKQNLFKQVVCENFF